MSQPSEVQEEVEALRALADLTDSEHLGSMGTGFVFVARVVAMGHQIRLHPRLGKICRGSASKLHWPRTIAAKLPSC